MKKLIYLIFFFLPVIVCAQQPRDKSFLLSSEWMDLYPAGFSAGMVDEFLSFAFSPSGYPYVAYKDDANFLKATVMMHNGWTWVNVGPAGFTERQAEYISLAFSPSGEPHIAFRDVGGNSLERSKVTVMKFNGTQWVYVGNTVFTENEDYCTSLAFNPSDGQPYVAYRDGGNSSRVTVIKFDGTSWVNVGNAGFSAGSVNDVCLAFSLSGEPYVAYEDAVYRPAVMKFDGSDWVVVGKTGFSEGSVKDISLAINPSGQPCVAYSDNGNSQKATVMKFNDVNWVNVGYAGFSAGRVDFTSLAFCQDGKLLIAFRDSEHSGKATVMLYDEAELEWVNVGGAGFSAGYADYTKLAFSPNGQPYVAFMDVAHWYKATVMFYDSTFTGTNELQALRLSLYPNPATDKITIETSANPAISQLSIMNIAGQELISQPISERKSLIDIRNLPKGVYILRVTNEKSVQVRKMVKQ